jgi:hypothetical protein
LGHWNDVVNLHLHNRSIHTEAQFSATNRHQRGTVWQVAGPINFISMFEIDEMMRRIKEERKTEATEVPIVLDMMRVTNLEFTGVEELVNRLLETADGATIKMTNCSAALINALDQCDTQRQIIRFSIPEDLATNQ